MTTSLYLAFVLTSVALIATPGPNVAVIVTNSALRGLRYGLVTVAGTSSAMVLQLAATVAGLSGVLSLAAHGFEILRWAGVAYLVWLGISAWRAPAPLDAAQPALATARQMFVRGFRVSLTNPKTLLFYAAFLPQFVSGTSEQTAELTVLAATFLLIAVVLDCCWALAATRASGLIGSGGRWTNRLTSGVLLTAAAGLAMARRPG